MRLSLKEIGVVILNFLIELPIEILHFLLVPIALLFCKKESEHLPKIFSWFDENDYGINGDPYWIEVHFPNGKNRTYWTRLRWLYRNRIGNFSAKYLGVKVADIDPSSVVTKGNRWVTNLKGVDTDWCLVTCKLKNGKERFGYYKEIRYKGFLKNYYLRIYVGWKLMDIAGMDKDNVVEYLYGDNKPILKTVWAIHPFKRVKY